MQAKVNYSVCKLKLFDFSKAAKIAAEQQKLGNLRALEPAVLFADYLECLLCAMAAQKATLEGRVITLMAIVQESDFAPVDSTVLGMCCGRL